MDLVQRDLCEALCLAVTKPNLEELLAASPDNGGGVPIVVQAWPAPEGKKEGFFAVAASFEADGVEVFAVAFRSTQGLAEWVEYPKKFRAKPKDGDNNRGEFKVFEVFQETLDVVWNASGVLNKSPWNDDLREMIWRKLNDGTHVWLTGQGKGGGVATVAAARLLVGDSVDNRVLRDLLESAEGQSPTLSVVTFNAPMALNKALANEYTTRLSEVRAEHLRFEDKRDLLRSMPRVLFLKHVGESHEYDGAKSS